MIKCLRNDTDWWKSTLVPVLSPGYCFMKWISVQDRITGLGSQLGSLNIQKPDWCRAWEGHINKYTLKDMNIEHRLITCSALSDRNVKCWHSREETTGAWRLAMLGAGWPVLLSGWQRRSLRSEGEIFRRNNSKGIFGHYNDFPFLYWAASYLVYIHSPVPNIRRHRIFSS